MNAQGLCNIMWSFCVSDDVNGNKFLSYEPFFQRIEKMYHENPSGFTMEGFSQLHQVYNQLQLDATTSAPNPNNIIPNKIISDSFAKIIFEQVFKNNLTETKSSKLHMTVSKALENIGIQHENEYMDRERTLGYIVDIYIPSTNMVIEVDGPSHYYKFSNFSSSPDVINARTRFKRKQIEKLGFKVVNLRYKNINKQHRDGTLESWLSKGLTKYSAL